MGLVHSIEFLGCATAGTTSASGRRSLHLIPDPCGQRRDRLGVSEAEISGTQHWLLTFFVAVAEGSALGVVLLPSCLGGHSETGTDGGTDGALETERDPAALRGRRAGAAGGSSAATGEDAPVMFGRGPEDGPDTLACGVGNSACVTVAPGGLVASHANVVLTG